MGVGVGVSLGWHERWLRWGVVVTVLVRNQSIKLLARRAWAVVIGQRVQPACGRRVLGQRTTHCAGRGGWRKRRRRGRNSGSGSSSSSSGLGQRALCWAEVVRTRVWRGRGQAVVRARPEALQRTGSERRRDGAGLVRSSSGSGSNSQRRRRGRGRAGGCLRVVFAMSREHDLCCNAGRRPH